MGRVSIAAAVLLVLLAESRADAERDDARIGLALDAGLPDGAQASFVYRPHRLLRAHAGLGYNLISPGARAGATWLFADTLVSPSVTVEAGRFAEGDANRVLKMLSSDDSSHQPALESIGYSYVSVRVGLEVGVENATYFLRVGMSGMRSRIRRADEAVEAELADDEDPPSVEVTQPPLVRATSVSATTGVIVYL